MQHAHAYLHTSQWGSWRVCVSSSLRTQARTVYLWQGLRASCDRTLVPVSRHLHSASLSCCGWSDVGVAPPLCASAPCHWSVNNVSLSEYTKIIPYSLWQRLPSQLGRNCLLASRSVDCDCLWSEHNKGSWIFQGIFFCNEDWEPILLIKNPEIIFMICFFFCSTYAISYSTIYYWMSILDMTLFY